jgi:hypothetical protein
LFTHFLVEGLEGEADQDGDGRITVDELYDYAYEKVKLATPKQTPSKFSSKQQGEIVLRQSTRMEDIKPVSLPDQLVSEIENPYPEVRMRAVGQLSKLLNDGILGYFALPEKHWNEWKKRMTAAAYLKWQHRRWSPFARLNNQRFKKRKKSDY